MLTTNAAALYIANILISEVSFSLEIKQFALIVGVLTLINILVRPIIKLVLTPVIILTLGLGIILVNATTLYILDFILPTVTIEGFVALLLTAAILSAISLIINLSAKIL